MSDVSGVVTGRKNLEYCTKKYPVSALGDRPSKFQDGRWSDSSNTWNVNSKPAGVVDTYHYFVLRRSV